MDSIKIMIVEDSTIGAEDIINCLEKFDYQVASIRKPVSYSNVNMRK